MTPEQRELIDAENESVRARKAMQRHCGHMRQDKTMAVSGQMHSDGLYHPICVKCQKLFKPCPPGTRRRYRIPVAEARA